MSDVDAAAAVAADPDLAAGLHSQEEPQRRASQNTSCCGPLANSLDVNAVDVEVDVIVPVHNAADTLREALLSALQQRPLAAEDETIDNHEKNANDTTRYEIVVHVCCYDDGSTDGSWDILEEIQKTWKEQQHERERELNGGRRDELPLRSRCLEVHLHIARSPDGVARGAGYARNRAVELRPRLPVNDDDGSDHDGEQEEDGRDTTSNSGTQQAGVRTPHHQLLCMLDSDDVMEPTRVAEQVKCLLKLPCNERERCLLGCQFSRDPPGSTEHYTHWANSLAHNRLSLERYREVTILQPTWMLYRSRFDALGAYLEAPHLNDLGVTVRDVVEREKMRAPDTLRIIHPDSETTHTLRLAEDLRFFHAHLAFQNGGGILRRLDGDPLVVYRHRGGASQSAATSRKLLVQLRARALESAVLCGAWKDREFVVWGAGRDGKDLIKALSAETRTRIACLVDVDERKLAAGWYNNPSLQVRIPVVHFAHLIRDPEERQRVLASMTGGGSVHFGRIDKHLSSGGGGDAADGPPPTKQRKVSAGSEGHAFDHKLLAALPDLPVVVCVAMYRTGGALEHNVRLIGRTEGEDLWHFS